MYDEAKSTLKLILEAIQERKRRPGPICRKRTIEGLFVEINTVQKWFCFVVSSFSTSRFSPPIGGVTGVSD